MQDLIYEIFSDIPRFGPGNKESTRKAFSLIRNIPEQAKILDIGCGNGASTFHLADLTDAKICALDNHKSYLEEIDLHAEQLEISQQITTIHSDMNRLPFPENFFDIIWAEGSIYNIGFENGLITWKKNLKNSGYIACSEATLLSKDLPDEVKKFWDVEYPAITDIEANLKIIEQHFKLIDYFTLPENAWFDDFYNPLEKRIKLLKEKYRANNKAIDFIDSLQYEIDLFRNYNCYYGYVFYIMQNI